MKAMLPLREEKTAFKIATKLGVLESMVKGSRKKKGKKG